MTLHEKLRSTRIFIKGWNSNNNGDCFKKVKQLEILLDESDKDPTTPSNKKHLELALNGAYEEREAFLKQKSRIQWEAEGV